MLICHIISGDLWAGAEVLAYNLLKNLDRNSDSDVFVILLNNGRLAEELRRIGLQLEVISETHNSFLEIVKRTRDIISDRSFDIIHTHRYKENIIAWLACLGTADCLRISTQHGLPEGHNCRVSPVNYLIIRLNYLLLKQCFNTTVAVSKDIQRYFTTQLCFPAYKTKVVHNGIIIPPPPTFRKKQDLFNIGSSGRLFPVKDFPLMVNISDCLSKEMDIRFTLAGDGPQRNHLEKMIDDRHLRKIFTLEGHLDDMPPFYQKLDLYLNTSVHEGIPLTILEAMAHGLPVIAPRVGGISEVVEDGINGFLISERDAGLFAEKCLLLARNEELRQQMSVAARKKAVDFFSVERMTAQYLKIYADALKSKDSGKMSKVAL